MQRCHPVARYWLGLAFLGFGFGVIKLANALGFSRGWSFGIGVVVLMFGFRPVVRWLTRSLGPTVLALAQLAR